MWLLGDDENSDTNKDIKQYLEIAIKSEILAGKIKDTDIKFQSHKQDGH